MATPPDHRMCLYFLSNDPRSSRIISGSGSWSFRLHTVRTDADDIETTLTRCTFDAQGHIVGNEERWARMTWMGGRVAYVRFLVDGENAVQDVDVSSFLGSPSSSVCVGPENHYFL